MDNLVRYDKIIDDMKQCLKVAKKAKLESYSRFIDESIEAIRVSQKFYIGDVNEINSVYNWNKNDEPFFNIGEDLKMPYPVTTWIGEVPAALDDSEKPKTGIAYLVIQADEDLYELSYMVNVKSTQGLKEPFFIGKWFLIDTPIIFSTSGKSIMETALGKLYIQKYLNENQKKSINPWVKTMELANGYKKTNWLIADNIHSDFSNASEKEKNKNNKMLTQAMEVLFCVLSLMDCRNVEIAEVKTRNSKLRAKLKKEPFYNYHVLRVKGKNNIKHDVMGPGNTGTTAFHLCRGHFKEYSKNAPLFGRYAGRYWWNAHARGSDDVGIIDKSYKIETPIQCAV